MTYFILVPLIPFGICKISPVQLNIFVSISPCTLTPAETKLSHHNNISLLPAITTMTSASAFKEDNEAYSFTLSNYGSIAPLPTLKLKCHHFSSKTKYRLLVRLYRTGFPPVICLPVTWTHHNCFRGTAKFRLKHSQNREFSM